MFFEDAQFMSDLYDINPELTCQCDEVHICQQCAEEEITGEEREEITRKIRESFTKE